MRARVVAVLFVAVSLFASQLVAQETARLSRDVTAAGSDYLRAVRFRGIDTDVAYYDPLAPAPPLDTSEKPERRPAERTRREWDGTRAVVIAVAVTILAALAFLLIRFGGGISISLRRETANPGRSGGGARVADVIEEEAVPGGLEAVLRIKDRRRALILLARSALARVLDAHGVLLQRSWTARDALRHIPEGQDHLDALRSLILASERVHFGGRDVTESEFDALLARVRPLFGTSGA